MPNKLEEILNRKPSKWGNLSTKTFEQDIALLIDTVKAQQALLKNNHKSLNEFEV